VDDGRADIFKGGSIRPATGPKKEREMNDRELHRQKYQAQLDEWKADVAKLKARAAAAKADAQIEMNKHIEELDHKMHEAGAKLGELAAAGEEKWDVAKKNVETTWAALKAGIGAARTKFKE
jgi:hypothetical protein